ncbi:MAG: hypothetical protein HZB51_30470 [Chloroflexi bacterium]|nr:hypothetical protein [Chloroflexota bacterium]
MIAPHLAALTFQSDEHGLTRVETGALLLVHFGGLVAFWRLVQLPIWYGALSLALLLGVPFFISIKTRRALAVETLAPLFFLYLIIATRFVFIRFLGGDVPGYFDYNAPDLRATLFRLEPWAICALIYTLAIQIRYLVDQAWQRVVPMLAAILILATIVWASSLYNGHRTHGVTGTDPYAYAQMGIDLATHGTPLHRFTLFPSVASLTIPWSPIVHTGYHIPINANGDAPTVWPIGGSIAFALAYGLAGEAGLYLVNPLVSLLLLAATGWLAWELFAPLSFRAKREISLAQIEISRSARNDSVIEHRAWIAALAIAILATSHTLFDWATVTMVDSQAALFTVLAIILSLRGARHTSVANENVSERRRLAREARNLQFGILYPILSGLALGAAYFVRHTQVLIAPAIFILLWFNPAPRNERIRNLFAAGLAALLVALPDLWYHQIVFGSWLSPESTELSLFSITSAGETISGLDAGLLAAREFGWLLPFLIYGAFRFARDKRIESVAVALWLGVLIGFHVLYPALRLRDLLPEFPALAIMTAFGVVAFMIDLEGFWKPSRSIGLTIALFLFLIRVWNVLPIPFGTPQSSFGYLSASQRAAFEQLSTLTPSRAVIGSTLNDGAIDLYARRETFIPTMWSAQEQDTFFAAMFRQGRAVYLLDDAAGMTTLRHQLEQRYTLQKIAVLDVPLSSIFPGDTSSALYQIIK